jgi:hypothetical protein
MREIQKNFCQPRSSESKVMNRMRAIGDFDPRKATHTTSTLQTEIDRQGSYY